MNKTMNKYADRLSRDWDTLAEDARVLLAATVDQAEEKVIEARKRVADALNDGHGLYGRMRTGVSEGAKAADKCVRDHPYADLGFAFFAGALVGTLLRRS